jgi:hypothetical protein
MSCPSQLLTIAGTKTLAARIPSGLAKIKKKYRCGCISN